MSEQDNISFSSKSGTMPSTSKSISNMTRIQRNVAEKQRRDKLNGYISELANIVPMVSMSSKRLDKTSILRLSAAHLRLSKSPLSSSKKLKKSFKWCPSFLTAQQVRDILESVDGFLIVTSSSGKILFTSNSVERYLGHQNIDMIGHSLFVFIHPEDLDDVKEEMERLLTASLKYVAGDSGPAPRCSFRCRMKEKSQPRSEIATYQFVHFAGDMTISNDEEGSNKTFKSTAIVTHIFKAFVRVVDANPYCQLSLEEATADEYVTRHSLDGVIIFADHRLSTITGHLPREVIGRSAYDFINEEDTSIASFAHHLMFSSDKGTGMIVYRLLTAENKYVYLKSVGCLQFDRATSQVDHFVCVNQHLCDSEGETQLKYFMDRFIPHIQDRSTLLESVKSLKVLGVKTPSHVEEINPSVSKLSKFRDSKIPNTVMSDKFLDSEDSKSASVNYIVNRSANSPEAVDSPVSLNDSSIKCVGTSQFSNVTNLFADTYETVGESNSKSAQCTNNSVCEREDKLIEERATNNTLTIDPLSNPKIDGNSLNSSTASKRVMIKSKLTQNRIMTPLISQPSENPHGSSSESKNDSIKREVSCSENNLKANAFCIENKKISCGIHSDYQKSPSITSNHQGMLKHTDNSSLMQLDFEQIRVSKVPVSNNLKASSFQLCQTDIICNELDSTTKKEYDKSDMISETLNTTDMHSMKIEKIPGVKDANIMLSTGSVLYSNELMKNSKSFTQESNNCIKMGNDQLVEDERKLIDPKRLSATNNKVVIETNLWPQEINSESNTLPNSDSGETFASSMDCCMDDHNLYFVPDEEMKDYLEGSTDISSILNSTLPFDDSSLPSVDGWSECFRPGTVSSTQTSEDSVQCVMEQSLVNTYEEKSSDFVKGNR